MHRDWNDGSEGRAATRECPLAKLTARGTNTPPQPVRTVMRVRHDVHVHLSRNWTTRGVVHLAGYRAHQRDEQRKRRDHNPCSHDCSLPHGLNTARVRARSCSCCFLRARLFCIDHLPQENLDTLLANWRQVVDKLAPMPCVSDGGPSAAAPVVSPYVPSSRLHTHPHVAWLSIPGSRARE